MLSIFLCRCEDYILIDRGGFGSTEICGNNTSTTHTIVRSNTLQSRNLLRIFFRTSDSESVRGRGFQMFVICAAPGDPGIVHTCIVNIEHHLYYSM